MDCQQASEIIASVVDGDLVDAAALAEAREHCASCPQCRGLERLVTRVRSVAPLHAPDELVVRLEGLAAQQAAEIRAAAERQADAMLYAETLPPQKTTWEWKPRFTAFASAAAVLLIVLVAGSAAVLNAGKRAEEMSELAVEDERAAAPSLAAPETESAEDAATMQADEQAAPPYIVFDEAVYTLAEVPAPSTLTTVGTVSTDLGTGLTGSYVAFTPESAAAPVYIRSADGTYLAFTPVIRTFGRAAYALVSDVAITRFGQWPRLPAGIAEPTSADGSPVFMRFGFDDLGVDVYAPTPGGIDGGFAIAPGTGPGDPAGGNPYWTWWERVR